MPISKKLWLTEFKVILLIAINNLRFDYWRSKYVNENGSVVDIIADAITPSTIYK